ncbi:hypothetical protein [Humisphaera borealis]|uniref:Uncharacterized protein n=1 Tax=Humisphaera borealis TaxID=2807512 RepID=A0A7M2WVE5_9BACT|nr:hypothetical protein [Humisphaera borealis]QOV88460.1 hypothetical protein IPV69_19745 [Humisphaera borealis]
MRIPPATHLSLAYPAGLTVTIPLAPKPVSSTRLPKKITDAAWVEVTVDLRPGVVAFLDKHLKIKRSEPPVTQPASRSGVSPP